MTEPLAEVFSLSRAREASKKEDHSSTSSLLRPRRSPEFDAVIAPLEQALGRRVNGPGLGWCLDHYGEDPEAFASCVDEALRGWRSGRLYSPIGTLCRMAERREDHRPPAAPNVRLAAESEMSNVIEEEQDEAEVPADERARRYLASSAGLKAWLGGAGRVMADVPVDFRDEILKAFGVRRADVVEELRRIALGEASV